MFIKHFTHRLKLQTNRAPRIRAERGDTIVEVLIAIAVISLILGGAYVTTNRSLQATRAAQERAVALKLAESQIERVKAFAASDPDGYADIDAPFCMTGTNEVVAASDNRCRMNEAGDPTDTEPVFRISITKSANDVLTLTERWFDVSGRVEDNLELRYRVYAGE